MAEYRGYTGKNNDLLKMLGSASSNYAKSRKDELEKEEQDKILKIQQEEAKKEDKKKNASLLEGVGGFLGDSAFNLAAGAQQTAGKVADVAIKGGGILDEVTNMIQGGSEEEQNKRRVKNIENSEKLRNSIKGIKDVKGENILGSKDIGIEDLKDPKKIAELAAEGLDVGLGATSLLNPVARGVTAISQGFKGVATTAAKNAGLFGALDATAGTTRALGEGDDLGTALGKGAQEGALSAVTQGVLETGGGAIGSAIGRKGRNAREQEAKLQAEEAAKSEQAAADIAAQEEIDAAALLARPLKDTPEEELVKGIEDFRAGTRSDNVEADYATYQRQLDELTTRKNEADRAAFEGNGLPNDIEGSQKLVDDFTNRTNLPDSVYKNAGPVESAAQVLIRDEMPVELRNAAQEVVQDRKVVEDQLFTLMGPEKYDAQVNRIDDDYQARLDALTKRYASLEQPSVAKDTTTGQTKTGQRLSGDYKSDVRFSIAKDKLDEEYRDNIAELDLLREADRAEVEKLQGISDTLDRRDLQITRDANRLMEASPDSFKDLDATEFEARQAEAVANLEQAQRFGDSKKVVEEVSATPNPEATFDTNPLAEPAYERVVSDQVDAIEKSAAVENFQNISGVKQSALRLMSPSQVLQKWGLRNETIDLHSDILRAESALNAANKADSEVLTRIAEILPKSPEAQRQIVEYLEGSRKTLSGMDEESAMMIRNFLDEKKAGLNELGFGTLDDYFPHMFDKNSPEVQQLFKGKVTGEIKFGNLKNRLSDSDDYSRDVLNVLTQYAGSYNRKVLLEPALKPLDDIRTQVELSKGEAQWLDDYISQLKGFDSSKVGDTYNTFLDGVLTKMGKTNAVGQNHYANHLGTQRMVSAAATMGLNPGTAIRNMTQMVNTVADIGPRYSTLGMWDGLKALRKGSGSPEWAELQRAGIMEGGVSQNYFDAITKPGAVGRVSKARDNGVKGMMSLIRGTDILLRTQAYYGAKALAATKGLTGKAAEDFAIRKVVDTQFITSRVDMPVAFNGQGVRSLTQLATFSGKQAGFLKRTAGMTFKKNKNGTFTADPKQLGSVIAAVATATLATEALKPLMGFKESEWIPFYDQAAPFFGQEGGDGIYRSPLVTLLAGDGKGKTGLIQALQGEGIEEFLKDQWSSVVPAGTQIKKTTEGFGTTTSGESRNDKGNLRYLQDMDVDSQLKASVFGQYSTEAGRNWIKEGFPTLSEKQTQKVDAQATRKAKEQYADFFVARQQASGRKDAFDKAKEAAIRGDQNATARFAKEYNDKVDSAMNDYWAKHNDLPKELQKELFGDLYINVTKVNESAKKGKRDD